MCQNLPLTLILTNCPSSSSNSTCPVIPTHKSKSCASSTITKPVRKLNTGIVNRFQFYTVPILNYANGKRGKRVPRRELQIGPHGYCPPFNIVVEVKLHRRKLPSSSLVFLFVMFPLRSFLHTSALSF